MKLKSATSASTESSNMKPTDVWSWTSNGGPTPAKINDDDFGFVLQAKIKVSSEAVGIAWVDAMSITVYYTEAGGAVKSQTKTVWFM